MYLKMASAERIELSQSDLESNSPNLGTLADILKMVVALGFEPYSPSWEDGILTHIDDATVEMVAYAGAAPATPEWKSGDLAGCRIGH